MTELPILFKAPMIRAILDGSKTQTRRIVKPQPESNCKVHAPYVPGRPAFCIWPGSDPDENGDHVDHFANCPYGAIGHRLWVKETAALWREGWDRNGHVVYRADMKDRNGNDFSQPDLMGLSKWRPSIFMPRWASRITLEVVAIRVQRLQDIGARDCMKEGAPSTTLEQMYEPEILEAITKAEPEAKRKMMMRTAPMKADLPPSPKQWYQDLWNQINGAGSWDANPWVWVIEFKRVTS